MSIPQPTLGVDGLARYIKEIEDRVRSLEAALRGPTSADDTDWTAPGSYANGWVQYDTVNQPVRYRRIGGIVYLAGTLKDGTLGSTAYTLPSGFRPARQLLIVTSANNAYALLLVNADGTVMPYSGSNVWFATDTARFVAEQ